MSLLPLGLLVTGSFMKLFGFFDLDQIWTTAHWSKALADRPRSWAASATCWRSGWAPPSAP